MPEPTYSQLADEAAWGREACLLRHGEMQECKMRSRVDYALALVFRIGAIQSGTSIAGGAFSATGHEHRHQDTG